MKKFKLIFYAPKNETAKIEKAIFATGAGELGQYSQCSFKVLGVGQFMPNELAQPSIGQCNKLELVEEYRVEILCLEKNLHQAIQALKLAHPYEEVAYEVYPILDI